MSDILHCTRCTVWHSSIWRRVRGSPEVGTRRLALEAVEQPNRVTYPLALWNSDSSEKAPAAIP